MMAAGADEMLGLIGVWPVQHKDRTEIRAWAGAAAVGIRIADCCLNQ
jgi:hypothetical protein